MVSLIVTESHINSFCLFEWVSSVWIGLHCEILSQQCVISQLMTFFKKKDEIQNVNIIDVIDIIFGAP